MWREDLVVIKLGGSVITEWIDGAPAVARARVAALMTEIASLGRPVVVVHGTGAFGKPPAVEHAYLGGRLENAHASLVCSVTAALDVLEAEVMTCAREATLPAFRVPAIALAGAVKGKVRVRRAAFVRQLLDHGLVPVSGGGFVLDGPGGFAVCSSDDLAAQLAVQLGAGCLVFATATRGVYRAHGETEDIYDELRPEDGLAGVSPVETDVSGGMRGKITAGFVAAARGVPTFIVDGRAAGNLAAATAGQLRGGTRLVAAARIAAAP